MNKKLLINNEWRDAASGKTMDVVNPATEDVIGTVAAAGQSDVDAAVQAARAAFDGPWSKLSARERGRLVSRLADRVMEKADEIARLETLHNGKPISEARHIEIPAAAECLEYYAGWADKVMGETIPVKGNYLTYTLREPLGVVAAIVPWNFPLLLAAWKIGPALATGNTVILKPAAETPLTALALGEIAVEVGLPPGVLNILTAPGAEVGQALVAHPGIDKIAFTGGTATGKAMFSTMPAAEVEALFADSWPEAWTRYSVPDLATMMRELEETRERRIARGHGLLRRPRLRRQRRSCHRWHRHRPPFGRSERAEHRPGQPRRASPREQAQPSPRRGD